MPVQAAPIAGDDELRQLVVLRMAAAAATTAAIHAATAIVLSCTWHGRLFAISNKRENINKRRTMESKIDSSPLYTALRTRLARIESELLSTLPEHEASQLRHHSR